MNKFSAALFTIMITCTVNAQQEGHFINTVNNPYLVNPAAGGMTNTLQIEAGSRTQWVGYNGGPKSLMLAAHSPIKFGGGKNALQEFNVADKSFFKGPVRSTGTVKHIVGGTAMSDAIGPFSRTSIQASYAIHMPLVKSLNIGAGISLGWSNFRILEDRVTLYQEDDPSYSLFLGNTSAQNIANANAGLVFYNEKLFVGISTSQVLKNAATFNGVETGSNYNRHYYLIAKYALDASENLQIEPNVVLKMAENSPLSLDLGARFILNQSVWAGIQYRTINAITVQLGANLVKNLYISYGYEHGIAAIQTTSNSTHEIQLGLYLGNNRNIKKELKNKEEKEGE